jgi:hypothetical protein
MKPAAAFNAVVRAANPVAASAGPGADFRAPGRDYFLLHLLLPGLCPWWGIST